MARTWNAVLLTIGMLMTDAAGAASWTLLYQVGADDSAALSLESFVSAVAQASGGALELRPTPTGDAARIAARARAGGVPAEVIPLSELAREDVLVAMDEIPFLATRFADAQKLWQVVRPRVEERLASQGLILLYAIPGAPTGLLAQQPITRVEEFKARTVVLDAPRLSDLARVTGAKVAASGPRAALLKSGKADLAFVSATEAVADEAWSYGRYYIHAPAWFPKQLVVVNRDALTALERGVRDALLSAADRARDQAWVIAQRRTELRVQNLRDRGVKVRDPGVGFLIKLEELGRELLFAWSDAAGERGADLVEAYYAIK